MNITHLFHVDLLSMVMISLVSWIAIIVGSFSRRHMKGDSLYHIFFSRIIQLVISVIVMIIADNVILLIAAWLYSNFLLAQLMVHASSWQAALASGSLALQNFIRGLLFIACAFALFFKATGSLSVDYIVHHADNSWIVWTALLILLLGIMMQSAIWPFHNWLISSLNSPTPVSAIMHAGVINAGGLLLIRAAPLYLSNPILLKIMFIAGLVSALIGALWKLVQNDIKRTLACSTMEQMGFMLLQCGLGLFSSALIHLCCHGLLKAYLFLNCSSSAQEKRYIGQQPTSLVPFLYAVLCGLLATVFFASIHHIPLLCTDTRLALLAGVAVITSQLALTIVADDYLKNLFLAVITTVSLSTVYGFITHCSEIFLEPLHLMQPQTLDPIYLFGIIIMVVAWIAAIYGKYLWYKGNQPQWILCWYVKTLNASQPDPATVTAYRKGYDYV